MMAINCGGAKSQSPNVAMCNVLFCTIVKLIVGDSAGASASYALGRSSEYKEPKRGDYGRVRVD